MTSAVEKLASALCLKCEGLVRCAPEDMDPKEANIQNIACLTCGGSGALVPGLRRECSRCKKHPGFFMVESWVGGRKWGCRACGGSEKLWTEDGDGVQGSGKEMIPSGEVMGVLVRVAPAQIIMMGEGNHHQWLAEIQYAWSDKSEWQFDAEADTPEEALAQAIRQALEVE